MSITASLGRDHEKDEDSDAAAKEDDGQVEGCEEEEKGASDDIDYHCGNEKIVEGTITIVAN
ncbi:unnamed protein product [Arabis nemorensis]|uniref:Uncharacterized protein n=1 Tax=Arabis nemorensis TaxID=586526 RepID=A0A565AUV1_9BRAS|nr:unnamed protein product [Arabis nemorensis]